MASPERYQREDPLLSVNAALELEQQEAVRQAQAPGENFHGLLITDDQATSNVRLGIRNGLRLSMEQIGGRRAEQQILDARITEALRQRQADELAAGRRGGPGGGIERARQFIRRKFFAGHGFFGNVRRLFSRETDPMGSRLRERYGQSTNIEDRVRNVAFNLHTALNNHERLATEQQLTLIGVPLPPPPPANLEQRQFQQLCNANGQQLKRVRAALDFFRSPDIAGPLIPNMPEVPPATLMDRLIHLQETRNIERRKLTAYSVYHPNRLQNVMDRIRRTNPALNTLIYEVLKENELISFDPNHPEAQALVAEIERRLTGDPATLITHLTTIRDNLPSAPESAAEGQKESPEQVRQKRANELCESLIKANGDLSKGYSKARALGMRLWGANRDVADAQGAQPQGRPPGGRPTSDTALAQALQSRAAATKDQVELTEHVNSLEKQYRKDAENLLRILDVYGQGIPAHAGGGQDPLANLRLLHNDFGTAAAPNPSTNDELYADTTYKQGTPYAPPGTAGGQNISGFERHINAFSDEDIKNMQNEIKKQYGARLTARKKVSARQMLYLLRDSEYAREGYTNQAQRMKLAFIDADDLIADARNKNLYNSVNNELSEYLGGTTLGSRALNRASKYLKAKFRPEHIFRGRDVIDRITGTVKGMEVFHGLKPDMSRAELQHFVDSNGITPLQLKQFNEHLGESLKGFTMANMEGKVELYDIDAPGVEQLIKMMQRLGSMKASEEAFAHVNQMEGDKHEIMIAYLDEYEKKELQEDKDVIDKVREKFADWKQWFSRKVLQNTFGERYRDARKMKNEKKMGEGEFQEYLRSNNLLAAGGMMASAVTAAEMAQSAKKGAGWTWGKVKGGSGWTYDKGSRALGFAWRKALRPTAKYALVKPAEYLIWKPVKWTAKTAGKVAAFPFVLAGSMVGNAWNWAGGKGSKAWAWAGGKNPAGG